MKVYLSLMGTVLQEKISTIKMLRQHLGLGLKEAKELSEQIEESEHVAVDIEDNIHLERFVTDARKNGVLVSANYISAERVKGWIRECIDAHEYGLAQRLIGHLKQRDMFDGTLYHDNS